MNDLDYLFTMQVPVRVHLLGCLSASYRTIGYFLVTHKATTTVILPSTFIMWLFLTTFSANK